MADIVSWCSYQLAPNMEPRKTASSASRMLLGNHDPACSRKTHLHESESHEEERRRLSGAYIGDTDCPWTYLNFTTQESTEMMQLGLPATIHGHTDDLVPNPGESHGADEHRRYNENTCTSAKTKNPYTPVSRVQSNESGPGEATPRPRGSAIDPANKNLVAATKKKRIDETARPNLDYVWVMCVNALKNLVRGRSHDVSA
ncbi:hypothetical protein QAD02_020766 [Eretmocerus hayati]|uniref:Uncharacterized protein n=1 Tax=Eretmocerus hayati TaxID=131215 RepID=A0ACC2PPM9_9HYME|nr:hypothetical protein QAD02_020766 [Eretmocerus hayati]